MSGDGCRNDCKLIEPGFVCPAGVSCTRCGNGSLDTGETCDDGNRTAGDGCSATCQASAPPYYCNLPGRPCELCGNGVRDATEACDDGNLTAGDGCSTNCRTLEPGWTCPIPNIACNDCGDGRYQGVEQCDDGNTTGGDGCAACQLEPGWSCAPGRPCTSNGCGDGFVAGSEECDDTNRRGGDGCSSRCTVESGWVCPTTGGACVLTTCGDRIVGGTEQCDDGNVMNGDGCNSTCRIETTCGDGRVGGTEACDDGNTANGDGCTSTCQWQAGKSCTGTAPTYTCTNTVCGDGVRGNLEACDDRNVVNGDGCSSTCTIEPFNECEGDVGVVSICHQSLEWVAIRSFNVSFVSPEGIVYDERTRSFVAYKSGSSQPPLELCLDGSMILHPGHSKSGICPPGAELGSTACSGILASNPISRTWPADIGVAGATYDPYAGNFLFLSGSVLYRFANVKSANTALASANLTGDGISVGEDGRLYVSSDSNDRISVYARNTSAIGFNLTAAVATWTVPTSGGDKLTDTFVLPGFDMIGTFTGDGDPAAFRFYNYTSTGTPTPAATSGFPGALIPDITAFGTTLPDPAWSSYLGSAETASDGSGFVMCATNPSNPCYLFALACDIDADCEARLPGTVCRTKDDQGLPLDINYCWAPATARDDYSNANAGDVKAVRVLDNDTRSEGTCTDGTVRVVSATPTVYGGTVTVVNNNTTLCGASGSCVTYTPRPGVCNVIDSFDYTALLGGNDPGTATVFVTVTCGCGNGTVDAGEECDPARAGGPACTTACTLVARCGDRVLQGLEACDDGNIASGDGCSWDCQVEGCGNGRIDTGEACDDGNTSSGDGCRNDCRIERCGDGVLDGNEQCDDGNTVNTDGCARVA